MLLAAGILIDRTSLSKENILKILKKETQIMDKNFTPFKERILKYVNIGLQDHTNYDIEDLGNHSKDNRLNPHLNQELIPEPPLNFVASKDIEESKHPELQNQGD